MDEEKLEAIFFSS